LQVIDGNPAIAHFDNTTFDLRYIRAADANGTTWGSPQILDSIGTVGQYPSLQVVSGFPAISYFDFDNGDLKYIRALDSIGTNWASGFSLDGAGTVGQDSSMQIVNGNPAVAYHGSLKFIRASEPTFITLKSLETRSGNIFWFAGLSLFLGMGLATWLFLRRRNGKHHERTT
jgi:hypothetical protein